MTHEIAEHLRKMTSRNGRYWLRDSRHFDLGQTPTSAEANEELPFKTAKAAAPHIASNKTLHESVVVTIPNVASKVANIQTRQAAPRNVAAAPPKPAPAAPPTPPVVPTPPASETNPPTRANVPKPSLMNAVPATTPKPAPAPAVKEASKSPADQLPPAHTDDAVVAARSTQSEMTEGSIVKIANEIISTFPIAAPSIVMFAGSEATIQVDEVAARVAAELASRNFGRALLIDSDFEGRRLTSASGMNKRPGLSEVMNIALHWEEAILKSGSSKLDFMTVGNCPHKRWTPKRLLRDAVAQIRSNYQFVCISTGDAHSMAAATWAELSDGALLVVSASNSNEEFAESAVGELRKNGARMVGAVVSDVERAEA